MNEKKKGKKEEKKREGACADAHAYSRGVRGRARVREGKVEEV